MSDREINKLELAVESVKKTIECSDEFLTELEFENMLNTLRRLERELDNLKSVITLKNEE